MLKDYAQADNSTLLQVINGQQATIDKLTEQLTQLQHRLDKLLHLLYGTKTEKQKKPSKENKTDEQGQVVPSVQTKKQSRVPAKNGRRPLPPELPRVQQEYDLPLEQQQCACGCKMHRLGKVITEQLDFKPAELFVKKHIRFKYACRGCDTIVTAEFPPQPIEKGLPGAGLLAEIIINKYQDALPLYRQEQRFKRHGLDLPRSTLCDWVMQSAFLMQPLVDLMRQDALLVGPRIFTDDTPVPVLAKGKTHTGRLWTYVGGGKEEPTCVIYEYTPTRSQTAAENFLKGYRGYLQADAFPGYNVLYKDGNIIEVGCWAHARRKFFEITILVKEPGEADVALEFIGKLYEVERKIQPLPSRQKKYYRRKYSKPILQEFYKYLKKQEKRLLPKTPIGKAVAYCLNHWQALNNYLKDGILKIDNNTAERAIKPLVIGRKNWLFAGSHEGAEKAAILFSIIETCKMNEINPYYYIKDVLTKLPSTLMKDLHKLLPYHWKPDLN
jgi:transposase